MSKVRWGILGTARMGMLKVISGIQRAENCEVVAIASRSAQAAELATPPDRETKISVTTGGGSDGLGHSSRAVSLDVLAHLCDAGARPSLWALGVMGINGHIAHHDHVLGAFCAHIEGPRVWVRSRRCAPTGSYPSCCASNSNAAVNLSRAMSAPDLVSGSGPHSWLLDSSH